MNQIILWLMLVVPWLSLIYIDKFSLKRFMPGAILASLLVTIVFEMGYVFHWWIVREIIVPWGRITSFPLTYGVFLVGTIWIFHFSFDKSFWWYYLTNIFMDALYSFVGLPILISFGIYKLENMGHFGIFLMMLTIAIIIYVYQKWQDKLTKSKLSIKSTIRMIR